MYLCFMNSAQPDSLTRVLLGMPCFEAEEIASLTANGAGIGRAQTYLAPEDLLDPRGLTGVFSERIGNGP